VTKFSNPVVGEVYPTHWDRAEQYTVESLQELFDKAWEAGVTGIAWNQYTPYFNDGDTCVFSIHADGRIYSEVPITKGQIDNAPTWELEGDEDEDDVWREARDREFYWNSNEDNGYREIEITTAGKAAAAVFDALNSGHYRNVCQDNFGDHAKIVATPDAFYVESFEHD
jgi:hypothetical protein